MGLSVTPPTGWEASIYRRPPAGGERTFPIIHAATVPIPAVRGDYGGGLVELLGPDDVFVSVLEFGPDAAGSALFQSLDAVPGLTPDVYRPRQLQRTIMGQAGVQRFFTVGGRAFCLYSVIGSVANRIPLTARANQLIGSLHIDPVA
jgi:hypothetical protein